MGYLLDRGSQIRAASEHLVHLDTQPLAGRYSLNAGGAFLVTWSSSRGTYVRLHLPGAATRPTCHAVSLTSLS